MLAGFYFTASTINLAIIIVLTLATFELNKEDVTDSFNTTITLLLAAVAVKFVVSNDIPRVTYLTSADKETIATLVRCRRTTIRSHYTQRRCSMLQYKQT